MAIQRKQAALDEKPTNDGKQRNSDVCINAIELDEPTDLHRWRLLDERGRQTWHYMTTDNDFKAWPQTIADRYHLSLPLVRKR